MILRLAFRYQKQIAFFFTSVLFVQLAVAERIGRRYYPYITGYHFSPHSYDISKAPVPGTLPRMSSKTDWSLNTGQKAADLPSTGGVGGGRSGRHTYIGGPTQPETQSFQSVNSNNMVDLFSGDFSYNIPLLDVGGYPVNIAYHSGITMDEEASWVGTGWNINPGSITRNMRGVPDDFNGGADTIKKVSSIKPNINWGVTIGGSAEVIGFPKTAQNAEDKSKTDTEGSLGGVTVGGSLGIFHTTYNGWGLETSLNASINAGSKSHGGLNAGLSITNSSQTGITINPSLGFRYNLDKGSDNNGPGFGFQVSSPYNSRTGLKSIQMGLNGKVLNKGNTVFDGEVLGHTFAWPTYTPYIITPMTNWNVSVTVKIGTVINGFDGNTFISGYYGKEYIAPDDREVKLPVFGYLNFQNYAANRNALTDFNREKELPYREKPAIPHIAVPAYTYDVFSISGEGTGGSFRPYRGDIGFIADHRSQSKTLSASPSVDLGGGNVSHGGVDLNANYSRTRTGPWESENIIGNTMGFHNNEGLYEAVYLRNPGEKTINTTAFYDAIGGDDVVTPVLSQSSNSSPTIMAVNKLARYSGKTKTGTIDITADKAKRNTRDKRSQVITYLTAAEASVAGLDKYIYHYQVNEFGPRHCNDYSVDDSMGVGMGIPGFYYANMNVAGNYYFSRTDPTIWFNWDNGSPRAGIAGDRFSISWQGRLKAPQTGTYQMGFHKDDAVRFWVNDSMVINNWKVKPGFDTCRLNLVKDHLYKVRVDFFENTGKASISWGWHTPDKVGHFDYNDKDTVLKKYLYSPKMKDTSDANDILVREDRVNRFRKSNHISEIDVLNPDGRKYVYGIPVYNILQKEVSFNVIREKGDPQTGLTTYSDQENSTENISGKEGYYSREEIPAYAHSFLLTGILSTDYVDLTGNGITDDDLGDAVKFSYVKTAGIASPFEWRAPYVKGMANYNEGLKSYDRDDKGHYIYGQKELYYLHSIESKTMVATFTLQHREDLLEADEQGSKRNNGKAFCLKEINLYSKADFLANSTGATPIKTVHFEYSYELCRGINGSDVNDSGKLTLKRIWFTYNGNEKGKLNPYEFFYHKNNPRYRTNASDKWGTYKDPAQNPGGMNNADCPYTLQDSALAAYNAAAWTMDSIKLPSGGRIKVNYESDDYAWVQNRRSTQMMQIAGFAQGTAEDYGKNLYNYTGLGNLNTEDNLYVYVKVPVAVQSKQELYARYLEGMSKLYFKLLVDVPKDDWGSGAEYVSCYAEPDYSAAQWYGTTSDPHVIWIKVAGVNKAGDGSGSYSPFTEAAINFLRLNLPSKVYRASEINDDAGFMVGVRLLVSQISNMVYMLNGFNHMVRFNGWARSVSRDKSFVRLNCPSMKKYGGGLRVKSVLIYDNWNAMTKKKETVYGQQYDYTTQYSINGKTQTVSSGVASWEPSIGAEENPFHLPIEYTDRISVLAPASQQYSEEPLGEAFYPGASVGYSKVRVRSIHTDKTKSANGYSENTFFTTKDFPTIWDWSMFDNDTKKRYKPFLTNFLRINSKSYLTLSQGFKVELNDMNGKLRTEASYSETDPDHAISYTENFYRIDKASAEVKHLNNIVTTIDPNGNIDTAATIGKDVELMADMRDQTSVSIGGNININADLFTVGGFPVILPSLWNLFQQEVNQFRSAAMTKVIYRYGIIDSVVHIEKGSKVSSKNMMYDAETGDPLLVRTQNEFNDPVYQFTYPTHWAYKGMGPAYQNIGAQLMHLKVLNGKIVDGLTQPASTCLTGGDELLVYSKQAMDASVCTNIQYASFADAYKLWVIDSNTVHGGDPQLYLVDRNGTPFSGYDVAVKVIRSGHRNVNGSVGSVASLNCPLVKDARGVYRLVFDSTSRVITADAAEMQQFWKVADTRKSDITKSCIYTSRDSADFEAQACSCMKPFFDYLINYGRLYKRGRRLATVGSLVADANNHGYHIDTLTCPLLRKYYYDLFTPVTVQTDTFEYKARIGDVVVSLQSPVGSPLHFDQLTNSACTSNGVMFKNSSVVLPKPDTITVRYIPFSATLYSQEECPTFRDSLTKKDSLSDNLLVENRFKLNGVERNAISVLDFSELNHIPYNATILSANLMLQADQRGHNPPTTTDANSVNPVDSISISLATPGWFPLAPLDSFHSEAMNSDWHREIKRTVPFQSDTIDMKDYVDGYRNATYNSHTFIISQGSHDLHNPSATSSAGVPGYIQSGYGNYYSTWYSTRYADASKWPVMQVTYVVPPPFIDTIGARLSFNSTIECTNIVGRLCYSPITDTTVNPYQYGILGNWRPLRSYVYYGQRVESDTSQFINTRTNGTIKNFAPFWIYQNNTWQPSYDTTRWVWNSATTLFNRKGFELENKDPLGRYNAGIYGYGLTLPIAVLQNSHYQEGVYEGFEDYGFVTNNCDVNCNVPRPFDFSAWQSKFTTQQAHTGLYSMQVDRNTTISVVANVKPAADADEAQLTAGMKADACTAGTKLYGMQASKNITLPGFAPLAGKKMVISGWVKEDNSCLCKSYTRNQVAVGFDGAHASTITLHPSGNLVEGWQRYEAVIDIPGDAGQMTVTLMASDSATTWFDDLRIHPYHAEMKSFVYNPVNLRLMAELDENNYATFYEYDDDGTLVRLKKETERGIMTVKETRSALLKDEK